MLLDSRADATRIHASPWKIETPNYPSSLLFLAFYGALLSILVQSFIAGPGNNVFHLPIIERLYDLPQFSGDAYIQSLRSYTSLFWLGLSKLLAIGKPPDLAQIGLVFFICQVLSRCFCFVGLLLCASLLGIRTKREQIVFTTLLAITTLLRGLSVAGDAGLFIDIFTHSEICNGLVLISIYFAMKDRFAWSWTMNGITFCVNLFIAVWTAVPLSLVFLFRIGERKVAVRRALISMAIGSVVFLMLALPVVYWVLHNPDATKSGHFDYAEYLAYYYPNHFLFAKIHFNEKIKLALVIAIAYLSFWKLGKDRNDWFVMLAGFLFVYACGILLPHFTHSKMFLNLHLLRVSGMIQLLSTLAVLTVATMWLLSWSSLYAYLLGPALVFTCCSSNYWLLLTPLLLLAPAVMTGKTPAILESSPRILPSLRIMFFTLAALYTAVFSWHAYRQLAKERQALAAWQSLGAWIQKNTPLSSIFLLPELESLAHPVPVSPSSKVDLSLNMYDGSFETFALRRGWVDSKRGAAVMWDSAYYSIWKTRLEEVAALRTLQEKKQYAQQHGIDYVVTTCDQALDSGQAPVFRNSLACLYNAH